MDPTHHNWQGLAFKPEVPGADAQRNYPQCWTTESQLQNSNVNVEGWTWLLTVGSTVQKCWAASNASGSVSFSVWKMCRKAVNIRGPLNGLRDCAKDSKESVNAGNTWIETSQLNKQSSKDTIHTFYGNMVYSVCVCIYSVMIKICVYIYRLWKTLRHRYASPDGWYKNVY